jgi:wobble nucleotide-excising tRNase
MMVRKEKNNQGSQFNLTNPLRQGSYGEKNTFYPLTTTL